MTQVKPRKFKNVQTDTEKAPKAFRDLGDSQKPKRKPMKKVISLAKRAGSLIAGVVTGGGSFLAGVDAGNSILIGASAIMIVLGVEMAVVKEFKQLFEKEDE